MARVVPLSAPAGTATPKELSITLNSGESGRRRRCPAAEFQGPVKRQRATLRRPLPPPGAGAPGQGRGCPGRGLSDWTRCRHTVCPGNHCLVRREMAKVTSYQSHLHGNEKAAPRTGRFAPQDTGRMGRRCQSRQDRQAGGTSSSSSKTSSNNKVNDKNKDSWGACK